MNRPIRSVKSVDDNDCRNNVPLLNQWRSLMRTDIQIEARPNRKKRITIKWEREQPEGDREVDQEIREPISIARKGHKSLYPSWSNPCPLE